MSYNVVVLSFFGKKSTLHLAYVVFAVRNLAGPNGEFHGFCLDPVPIGRFRNPFYPPVKRLYLYGTLPHSLRRQFSPLLAFGSDMRSKFEATLFRFPLRTAKQASASRLSRQSHSAEDIQTLLQAFSKESAGMLLFLKNVERMRVFEWHPGQDHPQQASGNTTSNTVPSNARRTPLPTTRGAVRSRVAWVLFLPAMFFF